MTRPSALIALFASLSLVVPASAANGDEGSGRGNGNGDGRGNGDGQRYMSRGDGNGNGYGSNDNQRSQSRGDGNRYGDGQRSQGGGSGGYSDNQRSQSRDGNGDGGRWGGDGGNSGQQGYGGDRRNSRGDGNSPQQDSTQQRSSRQASPAPAPTPAPPAPAAAAAAPTPAPAAPPVAPPTPAPAPTPTAQPPAPTAPGTPRASSGNGPPARGGGRTTAQNGSTAAPNSAFTTRTPFATAPFGAAPASTAPGSQPSAKTAQPRRQAQQPQPADNPPPVIRTFRTVVEHIPGFVKAVIVALAFLSLVFALAWGVLARTARFLRRQRAHLLGEIGVLQGALLPNVPGELSRLEASVAYRPAEGLAAGGDFYDAFPLADGRVGIVVGDVAGHGREALMHTALLRYTLRAYLEADLEPRIALQVAGRALDRGFDTLATVVLAVYDPARHVLRYASAGHPPPVFLGEADHVPVTRSSSPPIGAGLPTGVRQTTVSLPSGSAVCFFTDGLIEARRDGDLIGRLGLVEMIRELGPHATATQLLERVSQAADTVSDDMAACMFRVSDGPNEAFLPRIEEIEVLRGEDLGATLAPFLEACGVDLDAIGQTTARAQRTARQFRGAVVRVSLPSGGPRIEVRPANVESLAGLEARRAATV